MSYEPATISPAIIDAKGDLIAGTAIDAVDNLAVGGNGSLLTADSSQTTGLRWASPITTLIKWGLT